VGDRRQWTRPAVAAFLGGERRAGGGSAHAPRLRHNADRTWSWQRPRWPRELALRADRRPLRNRTPI
jgi:hypothetical protein